MPNPFDKLDNEGASVASSTNNPFDGLLDNLPEDQNKDDTNAGATVAKAEAIVAKADAALDKIITHANIGKLGGIVNPKRAAAAYIFTRIAAEGVDAVAHYLDIPVELLQDLNVIGKAFNAAITGAKEAWDAVPIELVIAVLLFLFKLWGKGKSTNIAEQFLKSPYAGKSAQKGFKKFDERLGDSAFERLGVLIDNKLGFTPGKFSIGQAIARGGPWAVVAYYTYSYRSEIYGAAKGFLDAFYNEKKAKEKSKKEIDDARSGGEEYDEPSTFDVDPDTGEITNYKPGKKKKGSIFDYFFNRGGIYNLPGSKKSKKVIKAYSMGGIYKNYK